MPLSQMAGALGKVLIEGACQLEAFSGMKAAIRSRPPESVYRATHLQSMSLATHVLLASQQHENAPSPLVQNDAQVPPPPPPSSPGGKRNVPLA